MQSMLVLLRTSSVPLDEQSPEAGFEAHSAFISMTLQKQNDSLKFHDFMPASLFSVGYLSLLSRRKQEHPKLHVWWLIGSCDYDICGLKDDKAKRWEAIMGNHKGIKYTETDGASFQISTKTKQIKTKTLFFISHTQTHTLPKVSRTWRCTQQHAIL